MRPVAREDEPGAEVEGEQEGAAEVDEGEPAHLLLIEMSHRLKIILYLRSLL